MDELRESRNIKTSYEAYIQSTSTTGGPPTNPQRHSSESYVEYLMAMKRAHHLASVVPKIIISPRARYRKRASINTANRHDTGSRDLNEAVHISTIASMVPDEIVYNHSDYAMRSYETALMFIDVSGFTDLCEKYTKTGSGGPSKLTQVLNSYIGAMVQEILTHNGDVLKFSGDAFLSMWKKTKGLTMQDVVHNAIDCGLIIQKNYGTHITDIGVTLKVKVAISAGVTHFAIIGGENTATYVIVGEPVWDVKAAEYISTAGDVLTTASVWIYVNEGDYCTQPTGDGRHTKVLGVGLTWRRVEKIGVKNSKHSKNASESSQGVLQGLSQGLHGSGSRFKSGEEFSSSNAGPTNYSTVFLDAPEINYREYTLRPAVIAALCSTWWPCLRRFMVSPVLRAVDNDEPMDFLTEVRHVVVVFVNIITKSVTEDMLMRIVDSAYKQVCSISSESGGLVNKVSMFDKDMMFLVVFGLRGLKQEDEAQKALLCAFELKKALQDPQMTSISIGVTSGRTYCGVVGHVLRREYTVIGSAVNKAARLMVSYLNKVTCDKETFVRSKLDLELFRLMEPIRMKGIAKPGPIYEFNKSGFAERSVCLRHPLLGRTEELRKYKLVLHNALAHQNEDYTKYRDLQYGVIVLGPVMVGKKRLLDEFLNITPGYLRTDKITLTPKAVSEPFTFSRILLEKTFLGSHPRKNNFRDTIESRIRYRLSNFDLSPLQIHAVNTILSVRFPLPENFSYNGDILTEPTVKHLIAKMFMNRFQYLKVVAIKQGQFIDEQSWRVLILLLETKCLFVMIAVSDYDKLTPVAKNCIANNIFVKMHLTGIARWYHAALACQLLDVQAIPADLEKVMESASGGLPGWIQNFVISLIQRGDLTVVTVTRSEATEADAVMPSATMLQRTDDEINREFDPSVITTSTTSFTQISASAIERQNTSGAIDNETIQMAVLAENYNFGDLKVDMTMDVMILKTYDSLSPFEKIVLKCGSVLGEVFSRRMLLYLLQSESSPRKIALAVAKLFEIHVLECEGGDFTRDSSMVLIHPAPALLPPVTPPFCFCLGTRPSPHCQDLPSYAFCGYMKFKNEVFRITTYELLTENQKFEMHGRALLYLERYTRRCTSCGAGCFTNLFGVRCDDGLIKENKQVKRVRQQIAALSAETRMASDSFDGVMPDGADLPNYEDLEAKAEDRRLSHSAKSYQKIKHVRSFSSLELASCECYHILLSVYNQIIDHCRAVGECDKLFDTYMEYADLSLLGLNIPQAIRLLTEAEKLFVHEDHTKTCKSEVCSISWMKNYRLARILMWRGACMLESGDYGEARRHLLQAMTLFGLPFPTSKFKVKLQNWQKSFHQYMSLYLCPFLYIGTESGWVGRYYDHISRTLTRLFRLFLANQEMENASLAAKWSLQLSTKSNATFRLLCVAYANMISIYRLKLKFQRCKALEKRVMQICHRKRGQLDITEVHAVCQLYISIFLFYVEYGKKVESLEFGLSVIPMISSLPDVTTGQMLVLWMLRLLLADLRLHEMVMIMREFFYVTDYYDLSSETWYYFYAMVIMLDTGYCVETYGTCEKFYMRKGDAILRSKTPEAAWNFFVCMWLMMIRVGDWERSIFWEEKIKQLMTQKLQQGEFNIMILIRLVEGLLITLVNEMDNKNIKKILLIEKNVKGIFQKIDGYCKNAIIFRPRYLLLFAYFNYVTGKRDVAHKNLNKALEVAKQHANTTLQIWIEHTRSHWRGTLNPKFVNYWTQHIEVDNLLDYRDFDPSNKTIIPYTFPLPRDLEKI